MYYPQPSEGKGHTFESCRVRQSCVEAWRASSHGAAIRRRLWRRGWLSVEAERLIMTTRGFMAIRFSDMPRCLAATSDRLF